MGIRAASTFEPSRGGTGSRLKIPRYRLSQTPRTANCANASATSLLGGGFPGRGKPVQRVLRFKVGRFCRCVVLSLCPAHVAPVDVRDRVFRIELAGLLVFRSEEHT